MINILFSKNWQEYELLDTGEGEKLERFGEHIFVRPYEDAVWKKSFKKEWDNADGRFVTSKNGGKSGWKMRNTFSAKWPMMYKGVKFIASPTPFRHLGFFPEQAVHWDFIEERIKKAKEKERGNFPIRFLNLFGYTGVASLFALRAGARVTHVDASKQSIDWVRENQKISGMGKFPMRIILDDALKFIRREIKRGNKYDCIIMDPPKFGKGPKGETWRIAEQLSSLLLETRAILSDNPLFVILNSYSTDSSSLSVGYALSDAMKDLGGNTESGELCLKEKSNNRMISLSNTAIWQK